MPKPKHVNLRDLFLGLQDEMIASLSAGRRVVRHPGALGDTAEIRWSKMLQDHLPKRYCVTKGFVVDCKGSLSDQIDVVIYDEQYSPFLFNENGVKYVPAESVYAVFEVKQEATPAFIEYAGAKAASVRRLRRTSVPIVHAGGKYKPKAPPHIIAGLLCLNAKWKKNVPDQLNNALSSLSKEQRLDMGCILKVGAFEATYRRVDSAKTQLGKSDISLVSFFLGLLSTLQSHGTVAALDINKYMSTL